MNRRTLLMAASLALAAGAGSSAAAGGPPLRVTLIGASIGKAWDLPQLPARTGDRRFTFEALQAWQYDKSEIVEETLMRPERKFKPTLSYVKGWFGPAPVPPDIVILKECSSYFPGGPQEQQALLQRWVAEVRAAKRTVVLATTVPVTRARSASDPGKQAALLAFNDWLRGYAQREGLPLVDLEQALRSDDRERYLRDEYTSGDGSHLNRAAYDVLDRTLLKTLDVVAARR